MTMIDEIKGWNAKEWLWAAIIIGLVVSLGLFAINQFMEFQYNSYLLSKPCDLCLELNKEIELCPKVGLGIYEGINFSLPIN